MRTTRTGRIRLVVFAAVGVIVAVGISLIVKTIRDMYYPVQVYPSTEWEPYINSLDARRESFFVDSDGTLLEAELFIPVGGTNRKPAIVFAPGSGDALYQNYAWGLVETYVLDVFLPRDIAVLLINKRGMGHSEGDYTSSSIEGRVVDILAAVKSLQSHPNINEDHVGLVGHSEGGWVVLQAAADYPEIAFLISLVGPTTSRMEQAIDMYTQEARCAGLEEDEREKYVKRRIRTTRLGVKIGEWTNIGYLGFDARSMRFDPRGALKTVRSPALFVFAEHDNLVTPALNIKRVDEVFQGVVPENVQVAVVDSATHVFRVVNQTCESLEDPSEKERSHQLIEILQGWLTDHGY